MFSITRASLRSIFRNPSAVVFSLVFPLIFILVFGFIGGGPGKIEIAVDRNSDMQSQLFFALLADTNQFHVTIASSDEENLKMIRNREVDASVLILKEEKTDKETGKKINAIVTALPDAQNVSARLQQFINGINLHGYLRNIPDFKDAEVRVAKTEVSAEREYKAIDFILPGQLGFSLLSSGVFGTAFVFLSLRQTLVIKRFFATPIKRPFIVIGEAISRVTFGMMGSVVIILLGKFMFGFTLVNGALTFLQMLILCVLGLTVFMGFGFVVSGVAKNESTVPVVSNLITLPQFLLSGTFFSITNFPAWLQPICSLLPLSFLNHAMRKVAFDGASLIDVWKDVGALAIWGILVYALAVKVFKWE